MPQYWVTGMVLVVHQGRDCGACGAERESGTAGGGGGLPEARVLCARACGLLPPTEGGPGWHFMFAPAGQIWNPEQVHWSTPARRHQEVGRQVGPGGMHLRAAGQGRAGAAGAGLQCTVAAMGCDTHPSADTEGVGRLVGLALCLA